MSARGAGVVLGQMALEELEQVLGWAAEEGWNPGLDDAGAFHGADPEGFFVARARGEPVAAISVVNHSADFAFLGLYICLPAYRGRGLGMRLWEHGIAHAGARTIGLDGVPAQQANYEASGFVHAGQTVRYVGAVRGDGAGCVGAVPEDLDWMIAAEAAASGMDKAEFLRVWLRPSLTRRTIALEGLAGFATVRQCRDGVKVGPLVAQDAAGARALLHGAAAIFGEAVCIDLPGESADLAGYCRSLGMVAGFSTARMYRGAPPPPGAPYRATATLELG